MIVFSGVVSDELQAQTMKRRRQWFFRLYAISSAIIIIIGGILWFILNGEMVEWIILSGVLIAVTLLQLWNPRKKLPFRWEYHITIDEEKIVVETPLWSKPLQKPIKKIKKVLDYEDVYYIIYGDLSNSIVCQKDLLVQGSIEEFKELFKDKIKQRCKEKSGIVK